METTESRKRRLSSYGWRFSYDKQFNRYVGKLNLKSFCGRSWEHLLWMITGY
jgi:hypothetical protein